MNNLQRTVTIAEVEGLRLVISSGVIYLLCDQETAAKIQSVGLGDYYCGQPIFEDAVDAACCLSDYRPGVAMVLTAEYNPDMLFNVLKNILQYA